MLKFNLISLKQESQIWLNTVENVESFVENVKNGQWDVVLQVVSHLKLPLEKLVDLYEQVIFELIEARELDTARTMLRQTKAMNQLKLEQPDRYLRVERLLTKARAIPEEAPFDYSLFHEVFLFQF